MLAFSLGQAPASSCGVSDEPAFATTRDHAVQIGLAAPPPDALLAGESLLRLAIEQGAAKDIAPISLDADGGSAHGVLIDHFRMIARASHAASAAGTPIDPKTPPVELLRTRM